LFFVYLALSICYKQVDGDKKMKNVILNIYTVATIVSCVDPVIAASAVDCPAKLVSAIASAAVEAPQSISFNIHNSAGIEKRVDLKIYEVKKGLHNEIEKKEDEYTFSVLSDRYYIQPNGVFLLNLKHSDYGEDDLSNRDREFYLEFSSGTKTVIKKVTLTRDGRLVLTSDNKVSM
jgi:hypothetical protein